MKNREDGLDEIYERIKSGREYLKVKTFKRNPTQPVIEKQMPAIFMSVDVDNISERSSRTRSGYPVRRIAEVIIELVVQKDVDLSSMYSNLRKVVFSKIGSDFDNFNVDRMVEPIIAENTFINENRTEGPVSYGLPGVIGMRLILDLVYNDNGF